MKHLLALLFLVPLAAHGQVSYASENDLQKTLTGFESSNLLNQYLWTHGFLDEDFHFPLASDSTQFQLNSLEIDFFKKNLFDTPQEELIVQLRAGKNWTVVVFYEQDGRLWKVPHCLAPVFRSGLRVASLNCSGEFDIFTFDFVKIRSQEQFNIITKTSEECGKEAYLRRALWSITKDTIESVLSWLENEVSYFGPHDSGAFTTKTEFQISNQADYPQELILTDTTTQEQHFDVQYKGDEVVIDTTKYIITSTSVTTYRFKALEKLEISSSSQTAARNKRIIGRKEE